MLYGYVNIKGEKCAFFLVTGTLFCPLQPHVTSRIIIIIIAWHKMNSTPHRWKCLTRECDFKPSWCMVQWDRQVSCLFLSLTASLTHSSGVCTDVYSTQSAIDWSKLMCTLKEYRYIYNTWSKLHGAYTKGR